MAAHRHQATWRSLIFNRRFLDAGVGPDDPANLNATYINSDYYLDSLDPTRVSVQDYRELRQFLEGAEPNEAFEGVRVLIGRGLIIASSAADLEDKTWAMYEAFSVQACRAAAAALDPKGVLPFDFKRDTAGAWPTSKALRFYARPGTGRPIVVGRIREGFQRPYVFQLVAFDPAAYSQSLTQTALGNLAGGNNTVTNGGNINTKPQVKVVFSGVGAASVVLANATTGQSLTLDLSGTAPNPPAGGETWVIDVARGTIKRQSDGANRFGSRLAGYVSDLFLVPGNNTITWSNATGITSVTVEFRDAYA